MRFLRILPALIPIIATLVLGAEPAAPAAADPVAARRTPEQETTRRWYQANLTGSYHKVGKRDSRWDSRVESALFLMTEGRAELPTVEAGWQQMVVDLAGDVIRDGCDDPLVRYAARHYQTARPGRKSADIAAEWVAIANDLSASGYPPNLKFFAELEAASVLRSAMPAGTNTWPDIHQHRHAATGFLLAALADKSTPRTELTEMVLSERRMVRSNPRQLAASWQQIEPLLRKNWPQLPLADLIDGQLAIEAAWKARGNGTIDTVTPAGYRKFTEELQQADQLLTRAWEHDKTDPTAPTRMLTVCLGLEKEGGEMEKWFQRAMLARPGHFPALTAKLQFLTPRWGGSPEALHAFGLQCLNEQAWGDTAPWILFKAHSEIAKFVGEDGPEGGYSARWLAYWRRPGVWDEVRQAVDEMRRRRPDAGDELNFVYATQARRCGMWDEFTRIAPGLPAPLQKRLAGTNSFERVLNDAQSRASTATRKP